MMSKVSIHSDQSLERTVRHASEYLTELDCLQQMLELECQKVDLILVDVEAKEKFICSLHGGDGQHKYCMLYMAKAYADLALFLEQQYLSDKTEREGQQIGSLFSGLYQIALEVAFVYMHATQTRGKQRSNVGKRQALLSWSEAQQKQLLPLLWRLCADPYDTYVRAHSGTDRPVSLSRRMSSLSLSGRADVADTNQMPTVFINFIHHHIARFAPYFLKRQQKLHTFSSSHLPPQKYLRKALAILLEATQEALRQELCTGEFHQKFLQNWSADDTSSQQDLSELTERYRRPVNTVKTFLTNCTTAVETQLEMLHEKFLTQCTCGKLFHVIVE